jgi:hypothetical protein
MQVFELYFNPKNETKISEGFSYKPKDAYEGKMGRIYMIGEITSPETNKSSFLQNVFHVAREKYYQNTSLIPELALKETLKEVNDLIKKKNYTGKSDILFLIIKNFSIYLAKIGRTKAFLISNGINKDIGEELEITGSNLFSNMVSGRMKKSDRLIVLTSEIHNFFRKGKVFEEISKDCFGEKTIEKISSLHEEKYKDTSGVAIIVDHTFSLKEKQKKVITKRRKEKFSFKQVLFYDVIAFLKLKSVKFKLPKIEKPSFTKKSLVLPLLLLGVILLGSVVIGIENSARFSKEKEKISFLEEKISLAREEENFHLLQEVFLELKKLSEEKIRYKEEVLALYNSLEKELFDISLKEELDELEFVAKIEEINPNHIVARKDKLYIFSSLSPLMIVLSPSTKEMSSYPLPQNAKLSSLSGEKIIIFSAPNELTFIENDTVSSNEIDLAYEGQEYISLSSFLGRPYLLDKRGNIFRYTDKNPLSWIKEQEKLPENAISLSIDGSIFVLTSENKIYRYHEGEEKEKIDPFVFPALLSATKIYTSPESPLFVLDAKEKRLVVISKDGSLIKQIFNEKFTDLKDISIVGEKIYLLVGKEVYSTEF